MTTHLNNIQHFASQVLGIGPTALLKFTVSFQAFHANCEGKIWNTNIQEKRTQSIFII